jgi:hypothetical protein
VLLVKYLIGEGKKERMYSADLGKYGKRVKSIYIVEINTAGRNL